MSEAAPSWHPSLLIEGWRGTTHSYALVNQWQLLALHQLGANFRHCDLTYPAEHWGRQEASPGFKKEDQDRLDQISPWMGEPADVAYRIAYPLATPESKARRRFSFATCEHWSIKDTGLDPEELARFLDQEGMVITPSNWSLIGLHEAGIPLERLILIPHGIDPAYFHPEPPETRDAYRLSLGLDPEDFVILSVGAMTTNKGVDLLLKAFAHVVDRHPHVRLVLKDLAWLYGDGPLNSLRSFVNGAPAVFSERVTERLHFLSDNLPLREMRHLYAMADCYASPYRAEGFGLTPLEAAACGIPVLLTQGGATDDYAHPSFALGINATLGPTPNGVGIRLEPSLDCLIDGLEQLIEGRAHGIDRNLAVERIASQHSWAHVCRQLAGVLTGS